jgi:endonuclease/exonuclease/phosphatase family metal-dependent hydrolase
MSNLRIVSWNCHYGLTGDKLEAIEKFNADILVIQECSEKDWEGSLKTKYGTSSDWYGDGKDSDGSPGRNLGILVLCREGLIPERIYEDVKYRYVLPYKISGKKELTLFAIWTKKPVEKEATYLTSIFKAMEDGDYGSKIPKDKPALFIGDFNTGSVEGTNSACWYENLRDRFLRENNLFNCAGNQEWIPTFFRGNGSWLDDHCFTTESLYSKVLSFGIGNSDYWRKFSDHCPIIVDFDL